MKYLVELVFGIGVFGLGAIALTFFLRFLLLTWAVRLAGRLIQSILGFVKRLCYALIFVFGPAMLGGFIIGVALQSGANLTASSNSSADPTQPVLLAFLGFFVIVAVRAWQWSKRKGRTSRDLPETDSSKLASTKDRLMAGAWARAMELAPTRRDDLLDAQAACSALLTAVELGESLPDDATIETATLIRNNLVALIASTERHLRGESASQKEGVISEMVKYLLAFGDRARRDLLATKAKADTQDATMRAYLASKLFQ